MKYPIKYGCKKHRHYQGTRSPTTDCETCDAVWAEIKANGGSRSRQRTPVPRVEGRVKVVGRQKLAKPKGNVIWRGLFSSAQNNTHIHDGLWVNLLALKKRHKADLFISRFTYNKAGHGTKAVKPGTLKASDTQELWYDERIIPFVMDRSLQVAPGLVFCGEQNISPTASRPLSGLDSYTGRQSCMIPHVKLAMDSVASGKFEPTKFMYTTGTVTVRNYIQKKAGLKAQFHHCYGALLVEVNSDGDWWVRQLNADSDGTLYDWDLRVKDGKVTTGHRVEAVTWGDWHVPSNDPVVTDLAYRKGGIVDQLRPKYQFMHDIDDFRARSHHDRKDPHKKFRRYVEGRDLVEQEIQLVADFLHKAHRPWMETVVVDSNHDQALSRWLREADFRDDPPNALFYLRTSLALYGAIARHDKDFHVLEHAVKSYYKNCAATFLREGQSFVICPDANGGIQCGEHGDLGPGGRPGTDMTFSKLGRKVNRGHPHKASIYDGVYTVGCGCLLDMEWNRGQSAWSHTFTLTYENGKRTHVTIWNGKEKA